MADTGQPAVAPGQIWADNHPRSEGRTLFVDRINGDQAVCIILTDANPEHRATGKPSTAGRVTRISLRRFRPTSTGYRFLRAEAPRDPRAAVIPDPDLEALVREALNKLGRGLDPGIELSAALALNGMTAGTRPHEDEAEIRALAQQYREEHDD